MKLRKKSSLSAHRILHSLKSNKQFAHENRLSQKNGIPTLHFQVLCLLVSGRVIGFSKKILSEFDHNLPAPKYPVTVWEAACLMKKCPKDEGSTIFSGKMVQQLHHLESRDGANSHVSARLVMAPYKSPPNLGVVPSTFTTVYFFLATFGEYLFDILTRFQDLVFGFLLALHLIKPKGEASVLRPNGLGIKGLSTMGFP